MDCSQQPPPEEHEIALRSTTDIGQGARQAAGSSGASPGSGLTDRALVAPRFKHVVTESGHAIATGNDGEKLLRCEDEPIRTPGAVQGFGLLIALDRKDLAVRIVSENAKTTIGYTPEQLFSLGSFTSFLSKEQADTFLDHLDFAQGDADLVSNGPDVFSLSITPPEQNELKLWCALHVNDRHPHLVICEFEREDDHANPLSSQDDDFGPVESAEGTLGSEPSEEDWLASTRSKSKPLRFLRGPIRPQSLAMAAMEVSKIISQVQEQLAVQSTLQDLLDVLVGLVQDLTGFHRTMVYQFDQACNGRVVTELLNPRTSKDLYRGLNFPATDIPQQARDLYKVNKVRLLYDRDQETARLVYRNTEDLATPLDLTHSYLRAMSPIHSQYLRNMAVRSTLSISITAFGELWGLITCHAYGSHARRIPFPTRSICRIIGDTASRNIERISYTSRLQMRKLINTVPTKQNPSGYITASSEDLLKLFQASFGFLTIRDETKMLGRVTGVEASQEVFTILQYLQRKRVTKVTASTKIENDFPDLYYPRGFQTVAGLLLVPLSSRGQDLIVFFRRSQIKEVKWAGDPREKNTDTGHLEPRTSFKTWTQTVTGSTEWTEDQLETAAVLCIVYGKFIEVWRQKEAALQNSHITRMLLANSAHEVRTPLNAIINYLEIALEGDLDGETRENLERSCSASKSLIYVINDLLDLTATVEGAVPTQTETFDFRSVLQQTTDWFAKDAQRKQIYYGLSIHTNPGLPEKIIGDARRLRQAISNVIANAIENTTAGGVTVDVTSKFLHAEKVEVQICVSDTGVGMDAQKVDSIFKEVSQLETEDRNVTEDTTATARRALTNSANAENARTLGLGLAVVARIVHNMRGQLRLKSEKDRGSRFVLVFQFDLPEPGPIQQAANSDSSAPSVEFNGQGTAAPSDIEEEIVLIGRVDRSIDRKENADRLIDLSVDRTSSDYASGGSVNRLMEAIQTPNQIEGLSQSGASENGATAKAVSNQERIAQSTELVRLHDSSKDQTQETETTLGFQRQSSRIGALDIEGQSQPLRASRIPDTTGSSADNTSSEAPTVSRRAIHDSSNIGQSYSADVMRVLVAEDDPINSKIIEKRLKKFGHKVHLTCNGEECAHTFREEQGCFDIILMDIQMPIMDGYDATKSIRSFEESHISDIDPLNDLYSPKSCVPIIAVSASLADAERDFYIEIGFDGWILKPISFDRLQHIMAGVTDPIAREEDLYTPGKWERGGWLKETQEVLRPDKGVD